MMTMMKKQRPILKSPSPPQAERRRSVPQSLLPKRQPRRRLTVPRDVGLFPHGVVVRS